MIFFWPLALWLLPLLLALVVAYVLLLRRHSRTALGYSSVELIRHGMGRLPNIRRHVPPLLFLLGLIASLLAIARPVVVVSTPVEQRTLIIAIDVSLSMAATDVEPSRLAVAQAAAKALVRAQPPGVRLGVLAISTHADLVQAPTSEAELAIAAIEELHLQEGSAFGNGIVGALITIFSDSSIGGAYDIFGHGSWPRDSAGELLAEPNPMHERRHKPVSPGSYSAAAIILLSDGDDSYGIPPVKAAKMAAERGVRVFTVGIGTPGGIRVRVHDHSIHASFHEKTLRNVAEITLGKYFGATDTKALKKVYRALSGTLVPQTFEMEITALLAAIGAILWLASGALSVLWFNPMA